MKKWKRVIAVLCALVCVLGVSVPAFAAVAYTTFSEAKISNGSLLSASYGDAVRLDTSGNLVVNISFDASTWSKIDEAKELWRTVMSEWNGNPDYYIFYQFARSYLYVGAFSKSSFSHISNKTDAQGTYHAYFRQGCVFRFELRNSVLRLTSHVGSLLEGSLQDVVLFPSSKNLYFFYKSIVDFQEEHSFSTTVSVLSDINNVTIIDDVVSPPEIPQYSLIVNYQYENGTQAAQPVTRSLTAGSSYEIASPIIEGYTADRPVVSGTMPGNDLTVTVTYTADPPPEPQTYTLTVNYRYENGSQAAQPVTRSLTAGSSYEITSPAIEGYTADKPVVSGTMPAEDLTVTVTYTAVPPPEPQTYTLTVNYQYENGTQAAQPVTRSLAAGNSYEITSPAIEGYTADKPVVSGTMPEKNLTLYVLYRKISSGSSKPSGWFDAAPDVEWKDPFEWFDAAPNVEWKDPFTWFDAAPNVEWWSPFPWGG